MTQRVLKPPTHFSFNLHESNRNNHHHDMGIRADYLDKTETNEDRAKRQTKKEQNKC